PSPSYRSPLETASNRRLSAASEALEINSRKNISRFESSERIIKCSNCLASASHPRVSLRASTVRCKLLNKINAPPANRTGSLIKDEAGNGVKCKEFKRGIRNSSFRVKPSTYYPPALWHPLIGRPFNWKILLNGFVSL